MIRAFALAALILWPGLATAEGTLVAAHSITAKSVIGPSDIRKGSQTVPGALSDPGEAIGREARVTLYVGRPIRAGDLRDPAVVERHDLVRLSYSKGPLWIVTEARALDRGSQGERIQVMNLDSRAVVTGVVSGPGEVVISR
ncbi:MAG: flagellar basal body P-ring formation chaperone FlgA [Pseudomonadota bacterium]